MSWSKWKMGLVVAVVSAICDGIVFLLVDPNIARKALAVGLVVLAAKAMGLYLKQHPVEEVSTDTELLRRATIDASQSGARGVPIGSGRPTIPLPGLAIGIGLVLCLGSGCASSGGMARAITALARDPAVLSVRGRLVTPWGTESLDVNRVGSPTNTVFITPEGAMTINPGKKGQE